MSKPFAQLHLHSFASLLDGCGSIKRYVELAKEFGHSSLAITDHGNMSSTYNLFLEAKKNGLKPIMGCEYYLQPTKDEFTFLKDKIENDGEDDEVLEEGTEEIDNDDKVKKDIRRLEKQSFHQIILVKNQQGWKNACKLNYFSFLKKTDKNHCEHHGGYYYRPRIQRDFLFDNHDGLIVTSSCMASSVNQFIMNGETDKAAEIIEQYKRVFGEDYYIELQINEVLEEKANQKNINKQLIEFARTYGIKMILTGDVHYANKGDALLQDMMISLARKTTIYDEKAFKLHARNLYFHNREDYYRLGEEFNYGYTQEFIDDCLDNTLEISDKCNFTFDGEKKYPKFFTTQDESKKKIIELCKTALKEYAVKKNFTEEQAIEYRDRLKYELSIINKNGYTDYFLVVWDIINFCKLSGIQTGIGRGSVGSSLVAFLLNICGLDPIKYGLFFERFVNPEALSSPDVDLDFDSERRDEVIEYIKQKYGEDCVLRIGNYNTFNVKGCLRDLVRVTKRSDEDISFICSDHGGKIEDDLTDKTIDAWFTAFKGKTDAKSKRIYQWYVDNEDLIGWFKKMYGEIRHLGQHAAGVLITPEPVYHFIPVNRTGDTLVTGYPESSAHKHLSDLGLLKLDILGLETVTQIRKTVELVKEKRGIDISDEIYNIDLENAELYKEFARGDNFLVFQFENEGISDTVRRANPKTFEEVAAINSLHRPAALISGGTEKFIRVCSGREQPDLIHPFVDNVLAPTKGVIAFEEQVSRIINACSKISLGICELIRKEIMQKKGKFEKELQFYNENFVNLCVENGIEREKAEFIKQFIEKNVGYQFNQSHSSSYAYLALQTLALKIRYPQEFYAVSLSSNGDETRFGQYISDAIKHGVNVSKPSLIHSDYDFIPLDNGSIAFGLKMVKGLGPKAFVELMESTRNWTSIIDFLLNPWSKFNKTAVETIIKVGGCDELEPNMKIALEVAQYHLTNKGNLDKIHGRGERKGQVKYNREMLQARYDELKTANMKDFTAREKETFWKEVTGFRNPFNNPFLPYLDAMKEYGILPCTSWNENRRTVYGQVDTINSRETKNKKKFWDVIIADGFGNVKFKVWGNNIEQNPDIGGTVEGDIICVELDKSEWGYAYAKNGQYIRLTT